MRLVNKRHKQADGAGLLVFHVYVLFCTIRLAESVARRECASGARRAQDAASARCLGGRARAHSRAGAGRREPRASLVS